MSSYVHAMFMLCAQLCAHPTSAFSAHKLTLTHDTAFQLCTHDPKLS